MDKAKRKRLERRGWKLGTAGDFLGLSAQEEEYIGLKLALSQGLRMLRKHRDLTQGELAEMLESSQSRVAKMEAADATVSVDLLLRSLFALGASRQDVARLLAFSKSRRAA